MAAKPVVFGRDIGQSPFPGQLQRRNAQRLIALNVGVHWHDGQGNVLDAMEALRSADEIRDVNTRYHDVASESYDSKWGIDFGEIGQAQVLGKLRKLLGDALEGGYERSLEIGAGTGYFSLNLLQAGVVRQATCTDISPGMVSTLGLNARRLGLEVKTARADAESLPFADASFDLVLGHAVLHHLPNLRRAFAEFHRVLRPGGTIVFAGEPSRLGDRIASVPKRCAVLLAPAWRAVLRAAPAPPIGAPGSPAVIAHDLERRVDIHAFAPGDLSRHARRTGFTDITVRGEELTANWFGWFNRALEASAEPDDVPALWRRYAFRGYLLLQELDSRVLEPVLPAAIFYNLLLTARRPKAPVS
jgi:SAM-dependent methyltransferase